MAAGGYPAAYNKGDVISGLDSDFGVDTKVFHAGTKEDGNNVVTNGGRILCVTALGDSVSKAQANAYAAVDKIEWSDCYYRTDIGHRAVKREQST